MASRLCSTTSAHPGQRPISSSPRRCWPMANRHGLGRGLGALLSSTPESGPAASISELPIESISPNPRQPRKDFNDKGLHDLAASFRQTGFSSPWWFDGEGQATSSLWASGGGGPPSLPA